MIPDTLNIRDRDPDQDQEIERKNTEDDIFFFTIEYNFFCNYFINNLYSIFRVYYKNILS